MIKTTQPQVGPGSYEYWNKNTGYKIHNPTIPREPWNRSAVIQRPFRKKAANASIRDNFDDFSDESEDDERSMISVPGPGSYIKDSSTFGRSTISKPESF